ncbi:MAG: hypothetical protein ACI9KF_000109 [Arenicella sp.]|jgi:hypothetical protein
MKKSLKPLFCFLRMNADKSKLLSQFIKCIYIAENLKIEKNSSKCYK